MDMRDLLGKLDTLNEGTMAAAKKKPTGPKHTGKWKGTDPARAAKTKYVGGESLLRDLEAALHETPARDLMREYRDFVNEAPVPPMPAPAGQQQNPNLNQPNQDPAILAAQAKLAQQQKTKQDAALQQGISKLKSAGADVDMQTMNDKNNDLAPVLAPIMSNPQLQGKFQELIKQANAEQKKQQQAQQTAVPAGAVGAPVPGQK
jgi:hypothetical protein